MMMKAFLLAAALMSADAATRVAVLEFGKGGTVRRTTAKSTKTTVEGVTSFWAKLHSRARKLQHAGMTVVPDIFNKPDSGIVIGVSGSGVDLDALPMVSRYVTEEENGVVGHMEVSGCRCHSMMSKVSDVEEVEVSSLPKAAQNHAIMEGLTGLKVNVEGSNASDFDSKLNSVFSGLRSLADKTGKTIVVHLVVEEEEGAARRREMTRRLEEVDQGENQDNGGDQNSGYYGYGYFNAYGEWVTNYKTMFQIQYFNVVLWTAVGLTIVLFFTIYLMMFMPLEADTLLFGESAKMIGDE